MTGVSGARIGIVAALCALAAVPVTAHRLLGLERTGCNDALPALAGAHALTPDRATWLRRRFAADATVEARTSVGGVEVDLTYLRSRDQVRLLYRPETPLTGEAADTHSVVWVDDSAGGRVAIHRPLYRARRDRGQRRAVGYLLVRRGATLTHPIVETIGGALRDMLRGQSDTTLVLAQTRVAPEAYAAAELAIQEALVQAYRAHRAACAGEARKDPAPTGRAQPDHLEPSIRRARARPGVRRDRYTDSSGDRGSPEPQEELG